MDRGELIKKIMLKKEFSRLPKKDVEIALSKFEKGNYIDEEKIKLTRDLLRKVFSAFTSQKLLSLKDKEPEWILRKHLSTRERYGDYEKIYERILWDLNGRINVIDLGAGVNGFSYKYFPEKVYYLGVEAIGQLVDLTNNYFKVRGVNGKVIHLSLFELEKINDLIKKTNGIKIVFLFKTIDSLEMLERDYSKKLLEEITPLLDRIVVSFATRSMIKREKFKVNRSWLVGFIEDNFKILDDFEVGAERYLVFKK